MIWYMFLLIQLYYIITGDNVVPTSNQKSITDDEGVTSNMLALYKVGW